MHCDSLIGVFLSIFQVPLLLTELEVRTVSYGPSFFLLDLWPKREGRRPYDPQLTVRTEKTRLVKHLLYLYCVSDEFGNNFYPWGTASNFWSRWQAKGVNLKSLLSLVLARFSTQFRVKEGLNLYFLNKLRSFGDKSRNSSATETTLNFSGPYSRPAKLTNHSARTN